MHLYPAPTRSGPEMKGRDTVAALVLAGGEGTDVKPQPMLQPTSTPDNVTTVKRVLSVNILPPGMWCNQVQTEVVRRIERNRRAILNVRAACPDPSSSSRS